MQIVQRVMSAIVAAACVSAVVPAVVSAQAVEETAAAAQELTAALEGQAEGFAPRFIATDDPTDPDRFVAAMLLPGIQLVIVSAEYPVPVLLRERVYTRKYRDAYQDLSAASIEETRLVIDDPLANGLAARPAKGQSVSGTVSRGDEAPFPFDGQWRRRRVSEADYMARFQETRKEYLRLVKLLIAQAKANP